MDHKYLILIKKLRGDLVQRREAMMEFLAIRLCAIILVTCWEYELWRQRKAARKKARLASRRHD